MGVYFILITVALLISIIVLFHNDVKFTNVYIYTYILLLSLLAGLRFHTGWDWEAYDYFFYELTNSNLFEISKANIFNYEPGFVLLSYISVLLHIPFLSFSL